MTPSTKPKIEPNPSPTGKPSPKPVLLQTKQTKSKTGKLAKLAKTGKTGSKKSTFFEQQNLTQNIEPAKLELTAQAPVQSSDITCGAKVDDKLFIPEVGQCYDLSGNWWDNKIQMISGGGENVCVDVWEGGYQEGSHQRQCGANWAGTSFPISHICCTEESITCGAKVDDKLFSPEVGKCYDLSGNWWDNKIQMISGGGANVCVDVWEGGFQEGSHQRQCGDEWVNTYFSISHICCE